MNHGQTQGAKVFSELVERQPHPKKIAVIRFSNYLQTAKMNTPPPFQEEESWSTTSKAEEKFDSHAPISSDGGAAAGGEATGAADTVGAASDAESVSGAAAGSVLCAGVGAASDATSHKRYERLRREHRERRLREAHVLSERRRREAVGKGYDELRELLQDFNLQEEETGDEEPAAAAEATAAVGSSRSKAAGGVK